MTSRERVLATIAGSDADHVPWAAWCFGVSPPAGLRWTRDGVERRHWYSLRLEHLHTLPQPWDLEDDFRRVRAWQSLGVDDVLDVSVPWSQAPEVTWEDSVVEQPGRGGPVLVREYQTPAGPLRHAVRQTGEDPGAGWVVQPPCVPLFEDFNIPRAVEHAVAGPTDVPAIRYLYAPPAAAAEAWLAERLAAIRPFAEAQGVAVAAWSAFGMDAAVWLAGAEGAILLAMQEPQAFGELMATIAAADLARTELACRTPGVDLVVERGWYSSTDFWSPTLFDRFVFPHTRELAAAAHRQGRKFAYVMTTGVKTLGPRLAEAGVDLLYYVDPRQDRLDLAWARDHLADRMAVAGGFNSLTLASGDAERIRAEVRQALELLGPGGRYLAAPVDALFPDTPWAGVEQAISAWREGR